MLRALLQLETDLLLGVEAERRVTELDELHALESGVGRGVAHDRGDEVSWGDFVVESILVFQLNNQLLGHTVNDDLGESDGDPLPGCGTSRGLPRDPRVLVPWW